VVETEAEVHIGSIRFEAELLEAIEAGLRVHLQ